MAKQEFSIANLANLITTEGEAYKLLEELRWGGDPTLCPKCGASEKFYFLAPADGSTGRKTRTGNNTQRRVWKCSSCRKQFSVLMETIFHGTKIAVRTWLFVLFEVAASKNSVSAWEISRKYSITNESAWHMLHRIREAMKREPVAGLGTLVATTLPTMAAETPDLDPLELVRAMLHISPEDAADVRNAATTTAPKPEVYRVRAVRWTHGWELHIDGVGVTQTHEDDPTDAETMVRSYPEVLYDRPMSDAVIEISYDQARR